MKLDILQIRDLKPNDAHLLRLKPEQAEFEPVMTLSFGRYLLKNSESALTIKQGTRVLGILGLMKMWPGVVEGWMYLNPDIDASPISLVKASNQLLAQTTAHRVQTTCLEGWTAGCQFLEHLGFVPEGVMRFYDLKGRDVVRYAKLRERA